MILSTVSFRIAPGKNMPAMEYLGRLTKHIKKVTGAEYGILVRLVGPAGHVILRAAFENVAAWDGARSKISADPEFVKMTTKSAEDGLFIPGSVESNLWQEV